MFAGFDNKSMKVGMIEAFCEIVMQEVKPLALSPVIDEMEWSVLEKVSDEIAGKFHVKYYVEKDLVSSDLASDSAVKGKIVVLYYSDDKVLERYHTLHEKVAALQAENAFDAAALQECSIEFRRILGYSESAINAKYNY